MPRKNEMRARELGVRQKNVVGERKAHTDRWTPKRENREQHTEMGTRGTGNHRDLVTGRAEQTGRPRNKCVETYSHTE